MRTLSLAAAVLALACNKSGAPSESTPPAAPAAPAPTAPAAPTPAAPAAAPAAAAPSDAPTAGGLTWAAPSPFAQRAPKSSMRVAEYGIEGDASSELGVFYFGADQGGSIDANMSR